MMIKNRTVKTVKITLIISKPQLVPRPMIDVIDRPTDSLLVWCVQMVQENMHAFYPVNSEAKLTELKTENMVFFVIADGIGFGCGLLDDEPEYFMDGSEGTRRVFYIYELQISSTFARRGYGTLLLRAMERYAVENEAHWCMLTHWGKNTMAFPFYTKAGYTEDMSSPDHCDYMILSKRLFNHL